MSKSSLIFYDTSRAYYASYYLNGFDELRNTHKLQISVVHSLPMRLKPAVQNAKWQPLLFAMVLFKLQQGEREWYFCIDTHDDNSANGYHLPLLQCVDVYFKVNHNPHIIECSPALKNFREKIRSISQFIPLRPSLLLSLSRRLMLPPVWFGFKPGQRYNQPYGGYISDAKYRLRDLNNFQSLEQIVAYRTMPKNIDIFYVTSFRSHPRHESLMEHRYQIMRKLTGLSTLKSVIGFTSHQMMPEKYARISHQRLSQSEYIGILSQAKVVIYTQGMEGCISSKFSLAMALGTATIGEPLGNNPELLATHAQLKEQLCYTDPDELATQAITLAAQPEKARELGILNATMFDRYLAPRPTAEYVLRTLNEY